MNPIATVTHRNLATIDLVIIGVYFLLVFCIGFYFARKERTSTDYFLASRDIGWFFIGASLFVSNISTEHFIGLSGTGASAGLADPAHPGMGVRPVLPALECVYDAGVPGAPLQSPVRRLPRGHLDHRLHLHENFRTALCRQRRSGTRRRMVAVEDRDHSGDRDRHLHDRRRIGRRHLYRHCPDPDPDRRCVRTDVHWTASCRRTRTPPDDGPRGLFPHD